MIPTINYTTPDGKEAADEILRRLRLDVGKLTSKDGEFARVQSVVESVINDVAGRGDVALVDAARRFDDAAFQESDLVVEADELAKAAAQTPADLLAALRRSIAQVREYQTHIMPREVGVLARDGVELGLKFTPIENVGLYVPGGKASYPSSLIMLAVPAQVAGVKRLVVCTPPRNQNSKKEGGDLLLAAAHELGIKRVFRVGGAAAIAAMAIGTKTITRVDKIAGPGNLYAQAAKRMVFGAVGIDGFFGPSEIVILADDTADAASVAADLLAQAEHDPGLCFLLTTSHALADAVKQEIDEQLKHLSREAAIVRALESGSAIITHPSMDALIELANDFAAEHVSVQVRDEKDVLSKLKNAGAIFIGAFSPVAAGDYLAGPSHCLPTNTTARFAGGISVYEFLKRTGTVRYTKSGLSKDAGSIELIASAEGLDAHAKSSTAGVRRSKRDPA